MKNNNVKSSFSSKSFRVGGYSLAVSIALLAIIVVINLFVHALPTAYTKFDLSSNALYSISEETENIVKSIDEEVVIYFVATAGQEDMGIDELLGRYKSLNSNIKVKYVDPATNPTFVQKYTDDGLSPSSLIITSEKRSKVVDYNEIYTRQYTEEDYYNYIYYGVTPQGTPYFEGEGAVTSAIKYVTESSIPTLYLLSGHGESPFDDVMTQYLEIDNYITSDLSLLTEAGVPADASAVICIAPQSDITADELSKIKAYLDNGGTFILFSSYRAQNTANIMSLTSSFGADYKQGLLYEGNKNYFVNGYPYVVLPDMPDSVISQKLTSNIRLCLPYVHGITKSQNIPSNISYQTLLRTSGAAYLKEDINNITTSERLESDPYGRYDLGVLLTDTNTNGKIVWFSTPSVLDSSVDQQVASGANSSFFLATLAHVCDKPASVSIAAKNMQVQSLLLDDFSSNFWMVTLAIVLPVAIIGGGFLYWYKRRKA